jgi:VWFA-related protein
LTYSILYVTNVARNEPIGNLPDRQRSKPVMCMARKRLKFALLLLLTELLPPLLLLSQTSVREYPNPPAAQDPMVKFWVTALNHNKSRLVLGLDRDEFRVLEGNQTQRVEYFSSDSSDRFQAGVLIDVSLAENDALRPEFWSAVSRFFRELLLKGDQVFVATFAEEVSVLQDWTDDRGLLDHATRQAFMAMPQDGTAIYDTLVWACQKKLSGSTQRKALIVVADAPDNASYRTLEESKEIVQRSDAIVYWVAPWAGRGREPFPGIRTAQEFTAETGGITYSAADEKEFGAAFRRIAFVFSNLYAFGYHPRNPARDGRFHRITVQCTRPQVKIITREGYYAPGS